MRVMYKMFYVFITSERICFRERQKKKMMFFVFVVQEVLKQLQGTIEEDSKDSQGQIDFLERLKGMRFDFKCIYTPVEQNETNLHLFPLNNLFNVEEKPVGDIFWYAVCPPFTF